VSGSATGGNQGSGGTGINGTAVVGGIVGSLLFSGMLAVIALIVILGTIILCCLDILLAPLVLFCTVVPVCSSDSGGGGVNADQIATIDQGDGSGDLYADSVPKGVLKPIQKAGALCPDIGPIVIAAQIQQASAFNAKLVGPDGRKGISQLPPDKFKQFGKDDDNNGKTSALDATDSIMAQGRYMCSLSDDIYRLLINNQVSGDRLDLTLAAYDVGLDAIKQAKGVPDNAKTKSYIVGVRSGFAVFAGIVKTPDGSPYPTLSSSPTGGQ
jgi:hypothetical protein